MRFSRAKWTAVVLSVILAVSTLSACNTGDGQGAADGNGQDGQMEAQNQPNRGRMQDGGYGRNTAGRHANTRMETSQEIADRIADMDEIETANVLLTDRNAYIAVEMNETDDANGLDERESANQHESGHQRNQMAPGGMNRNNANSADDPYGGMNRRGGNDAGGRGNAMHPGAGNLNDEFAGEYGVSDRIKQKIADEVRGRNPQIRNVFVSANPDFMDRVNGFMEEMEDGRPVRGLVNEFNTMVERMFPENR